MIIIKKFDSRNVYWDRDYMLSMLFLSSAHVYLTKKMEAKGYIILQEVYDAIGFKPTQESCTYGLLAKDGRLIYTYSRIDNTSDIEITFDCYPILEYLDKEEVAE